MLLVQPMGSNTGDQHRKLVRLFLIQTQCFSVFPTRVSTKDILTLTRQYNGRTDGDLTYTIVAGSKTIKGTMPGVRDKRETTIDLNKELQGVEASELKVTITNARGIKVVESTVPLVIPD